MKALLQHMLSTHSMESVINHNLYMVLDHLHLLEYAVNALVMLKLDYELNGKYFSGDIQFL